MKSRVCLEKALNFLSTLSSNVKMGLRYSHLIRSRTNMIFPLFSRMKMAITKILCQIGKSSRFLVKYLMNKKVSAPHKTNKERLTY